MATTNSDRPAAPPASDEDTPSSKLPRVRADYRPESGEQRSQEQNVMALVREQCRTLQESLAAAQAQNRSLLDRIARYADAIRQAEDSRGGQADESEERKRDAQLIALLQKELRQAVIEKARFHDELARAAQAIELFDDTWPDELRSLRAEPDWKESDVPTKLQRLHEWLASRLVSAMSVAGPGASKASSGCEPAVDGRQQGGDTPGSPPDLARLPNAAVRKLAFQVAKLREHLTASVQRNRRLTRLLAAGRDGIGRIDIGEAVGRDRTAPRLLPAAGRRQIARIRRLKGRVEGLGRRPIWRRPGAEPFLPRFCDLAGLIETALRSLQTLSDDADDQAIQCESLGALATLIEQRLASLDTDITAVESEAPPGTRRSVPG